MFNLLSVEVPNWIVVVSGLFVSSGVGYYIVQRFAERKKNKNSELQQEADHKKTDAETEKIKAEAIETKAKADVAVAEVALKMVEKLTVDCDSAKKELKEKEMTLDKTQQDLNSVRQSLKQALEKIDSLQAELDKEVQINIDMKEKNLSMAQQILELTVEIKKLKGHG